MNGPSGLPSTAPFKAIERRLAQGILPRGWIDGLILSNDTTDATNDIAIAAGAARSTVNIVDGEASTRARDQIDLELPVAIIKQLDVAFAPENYDPEGFSGGDRSGGRSSSAISNTTWHAILAGGPGLQTDVFLHDSITQANVLAEMQKIGGYTAYRRIGSTVRASAAILTFIQFDDLFTLKVPVLDIDSATPGTSAVTATLASVPTGIQVEAHLNVVSVLNSAGLYISSLDATDAAASSTVAPLATLWAGSWSAGANLGAQVRVLTNTSAQIRYRMTSNQSIKAAILGWRDLRGRNS
jgi:hypothetical protein